VKVSKNTGFLDNYYVDRFTKHKIVQRIKLGDFTLFDDHSVVLKCVCL
jgi:hypothetical protein